MRIIYGSIHQLSVSSLMLNFTKKYAELLDDVTKE
jgi:hypothetical protein